MAKPGRPEIHMLVAMICFLAATTFADEVRVYLNQGGGLTWKREVLSTTGSHDIVLADIGADGDIDIVGANHAGSFQAVQLCENLTRTIGKGDR